MNNKNIKSSQYISKAIIAVLFSFIFSTHAYASDITSDNLLYLINQKRQIYNLAPLRINPELTQAAYLKSKDMVNRNYFEHYYSGLRPWDFMKNSGYDYLYAGENLAMDFQTSEGMVNAWMNSKAHRDNILNSDYTDIGFGIVKGEYTENNYTKDTVMVTNMFGRKKPAIVKVFNYISDNIFHVFK